MKIGLLFVHVYSMMIIRVKDDTSIYRIKSLSCLSKYAYRDDFVTGGKVINYTILGTFKVEKFLF